MYSGEKNAELVGNGCDNNLVSSITIQLPDTVYLVRFPSTQVHAVLVNLLQATTIS